MDKISESRDLNRVICEDGGVLIELYKSPHLGQITLRTIPPGEVVGGHFHKLKNERWLVLGEASIRLQYLNGTRELITTGDSASKILDVPAGTRHQILNHSQDEVVIVFHSDRIYNSDEPDKEPWQWT